MTFQGLRQHLDPAWLIPEPVGFPPCYNSFLKWSRKVLDSPEASCRGHDTVHGLPAGCRRRPAGQPWSLPGTQNWRPI